MNALRAHFEDLASRWDAQQTADRHDVLRDLLLPLAHQLAQATAILEIGTGTGALIPCLRERAPGALLVSIDLAQAMLRRALVRCPDAHLVQADVHRLPFALPGGGDPFSLAVCHNSFPHFADKLGALRELRRVLVPGGQLFILHDLGRAQVNAIHSSGGPAIRQDLLPPAEETLVLLRQAGFSDVWVEDLPDQYRAGGRTAL